MIRQAAASLAFFSQVRATEVRARPRHHAPAPGCATTSGARSAATGTRPAPAGWGRRRPGAVVDPELRVRGITGLRVADASVMPVIPNAPLNATVLAIAEKAANLITGRD